MKRNKDHRATRIGIAIPCHVKDEPYLETCLQAIANLSPPPCTYLVDLNRGEGGLKGIRTRLFDELFKTCDVVLQCDVEFYLFPDILAHVRKRRPTSFSNLTRSFSDIIKVIARFLSRNPWTGCYSLTKIAWQRIKISQAWDGTDTSIQKAIHDYAFVYTPKYYILRRSPRRIQKALNDEGLLKKMRNLLLRGI